MERKMLNENDYIKIIKEWDSMTIEQLAEEVGTSVNTIRKSAQKLREKDPSLCPKAKRRTRDDIAEAAIRIFRSQAA